MFSYYRMCSREHLETVNDSLSGLELRVSLLQLLLIRPAAFRLQFRISFEIKFSFKFRLGSAVSSLDLVPG